MDRRSLIIAIVAGLVLQLAMILAGHFVPFVREKVFAAGGMAISLAAGLLYARMAHGGWSPILIGGAVAGGVCALLGIIPSVALGDTAASILLIGTLGSTVAGAVGGAIGKLIG
jgi:hypothetical protein